MMWGYDGFGHMGFGGVGMILFWILLIAALVVLVRWLAGLGQDHRRRGGDRTPVEILRERYARGEIDRQEFEQKQRDLGPG